MNIFDENGECYFICPLNHSSQEKRTATGKHAFAGRYIDSTLTQEVIELRKELSCHAANQLLHFTRKDSRLIANDLINIAVLQDPGIERVTFECGFVGLTGIPSYSQYERALEELDSIGVKRINVMVDSDYQVKEEVRKARDRYIEMGAAAGFEMAPITWTQKQKGVDDLYKHLFRDK